MAAASTSGTRADGRGLEEFRTAFLKTGVLSQAKGSAYAEFGASKIMVGVFGPRPSEVRLGFTDTGRLSCEVKLTTFAAAKLSKIEQGHAEGSLTYGLQQALESSILLDRYPKAVLDVSVMVLESGGSDLAVAITAASLALADAGVELQDLVAAVQVSKQRGALLLDPSMDESLQEEGSTTLAMMPGLNEVTLLSVKGVWSSSETRDALELGMGGCGQLKGLMRETLMAAAVAAQQ